MNRIKKIVSKCELAAIAFASGFLKHAHTSSSLGILAGTLAVGGLVADHSLNQARRLK
ncbi:hypothetical protein ACS15_1432 [Ralstonia insidiosa]|uniref:Uncharacterized protein n=1 Tax=Ralstonia insidiosa TaxID=190721 RepID=A0AAC9FPM1_9RALS|nr:hypothetical protein ACS15_1432 [Ralstonia insidiosa]